MFTVSFRKDSLRTPRGGRLPLRWGGLVALVCMVMGTEPVLGEPSSRETGPPRFFAPDLSQPLRQLVSNGVPITLYASQPSERPEPAFLRDATVFTAGSLNAPYFYPQQPYPTSMQLRAQTHYYDLMKSQTLVVQVTGLTPNTVYYYRVGDSTELHRFKTPPPQGQFEPLQFAVIGDTQGPYDTEGFENLTKDRKQMEPFAVANQAQHAEFNQAAEAIRRQGRPDLVLHVGDLIEDTRYAVQWTRELFSHLKYLLTLAPVFPVMGNHEYHDPRFHRYFSLPLSREERHADPERAYYSFDWGNVHFIMLDMNGHWYTLYDIDQVPTATGFSYDIDSQPHYYDLERVGGRTYTLTDAAGTALADFLSAEQLARLEALKNQPLERESFQQRLSQLGFNAGENRIIRTATIDCAHRNLRTGRVELMIQSGAMHARQKAWLRQDLERNRNSKYIFVCTHHPQLLGGSDNKAYTALYEEFQVSAVFSGHAHIYGHHFRNDVHYFVTGGGSDTAWTRGDPPLTQRADPAPTDERGRISSSTDLFLFQRFGPQYTSVEVGKDRALVRGADLENHVFEETILWPRER